MSALAFMGAAILSAPMALAFSAGMASAVNPCGFALLPAYLTYFLGLENKDGSETHDIKNPFLRAVIVSGTMTLGFVLVFGATGIVWSSISSAVGSKLPWVTIVLGILIIIGGIAMFRGFQPVLNIPKLQMKAQSQELSSIFLFGVSYAVASLSCTIGVYAALVSSNFENASFWSGLMSFVLYGLGMGSVVAVLTLAVSFAREGLIAKMRGILPHMGKISGVLMVLAGAFVAYYGWWETQVLAGNQPGDGLAGVATRWQGDIQNWIANTGEEKLGLAVGLIVVASVAIGAVIRRAKTSETSSDLI